MTWFSPTGDPLKFRMEHIKAELPPPFTGNPDKDLLGWIQRYVYCCKLVLFKVPVLCWGAFNNYVIHTLLIKFTWTINSLLDSDSLMTELDSPDLVPMCLRLIISSYITTLEQVANEKKAKFEALERTVQNYHQYIQQFEMTYDSCILFNRQLQYSETYLAKHLLDSCRVGAEDMRQLRLRGLSVYVTDASGIPVKETRYDYKWIKESLIALSDWSNPKRTALNWYLFDK